VTDVAPKSSFAKFEKDQSEESEDASPDGEQRPLSLTQSKNSKKIKVSNTKKHVKTSKKDKKQKIDRKRKNVKRHT
jgi:hypothetical protein